MKAPGKFLVVVAGALAACSGVSACEAVVGAEDRPLAEDAADAAANESGAVAPGTDASSDVVVVPSGCEGSPRARPEVLVERCGIFVAPTGLDFNPGTRASPAQTLNAAVRAAVYAHLPYVFACGGTYAERLEIQGTPVSVFGGFSCDKGTWAVGTQTTPPTPPTVVHPAEGLALHVDATPTPLMFEAIHFESSSGTATNSSSIVALLTSASNVMFTACELVAGAGASGAAGSPGVVANGGGEAGNVASAQTPGAEKTCSCKLGTIDFGTTTGGSGGFVPTAPTAGLPALGGGAAGANTAPCAAGATGANGPSGNPPAVPTMPGQVVANVWTPTRGGDGTNGGIAQGGGGGGSYDSLAAGGGGGCGGCPSTGGTGGQGGGASIAIVAVDTPVTVADTRIATGAAGAGGNGGDSPSGQTGGAGQGNVSGLGCAGGQGGAGGSGGAGGGGAGGSSIGIVYRGKAPTIDAASEGKLTIGTAGTPGKGRIPGPTHFATGPAGVSAKTWASP